MDELKLLFFALGTLGFFANVYLSVKHPELVKVLEAVPEDGPTEAAAEAAEEGSDPIAWRKWDKAATWLMWGGWGLAAGLTLLARIQKNLGFEESLLLF